MTVTVWWASPAQVLGWHDSLLTDAERGRAAAYRRQIDRDRFTVANALLRLAVAERLGHLPTIDRACSTCDQPHGKPRIVDSDLQVSVSHSGDWIAVALTDLGPVGVDVEELKAQVDTDTMARYVFSPQELSTLAEGERDFYRAWTRKESVLKATGDGMRVAMSTLTVLPSSEYNIRDLAPRPGYAAAVTVLTDVDYTVTELDGSPLLAIPLPR